MDLRCAPRAIICTCRYGAAGVKRGRSRRICCARNAWRGCACPVRSCSKKGHESGHGTFMCLSSWACSLRRMPGKDRTMLLHPTAKAHRELHRAMQTLTMRQRSVLLLAQHRQTADALGLLFNGMGEQIVGDLLAQGYLTTEEASTSLDSTSTNEHTDVEPIGDER